MKSCSFDPMKHTSDQLQGTSFRFHILSSTKAYCDGRKRLTPRSLARFVTSLEQAGERFRKRKLSYISYERNRQVRGKVKISFSLKLSVQCLP